MDDCLFKPTSLKALAERLALAQPATAVAVVLPLEPAQGALLDFSHLGQLVDGDKAALFELLGDLAQSNEQDLTRLAAMVFEEDIQGLSDLAHKVKGGARIVKAHGLISACERLEAVCLAQHDEDALERAVAQVSTQMRTLAASLVVYLKRR